MAELLVRLFDKYQGSDLMKIAKTTARGDVIVVVPDGWNWSFIERTSYGWLIVKVPSMTVLQAEALRSPQIGDANLHPYLRIRAFGINVDDPSVQSLNIPSDATARANYAAKVVRPVESVTVNVSAVNVLKFVRNVIPDPAVIG